MALPKENSTVVTVMIMLLILMNSIVTINSQIENCISIDAAINFNSSYYLLFGDHYIQLDKNRREVKVGRKQDVFPGITHITSGYQLDQHLVLFNTHNYILVFDMTIRRSVAAFPFQENGHPYDAIATIGKDWYVFTGCTYSFPNNLGNKSVIALGYYGLPCNIDAACRLNSPSNYLAVIKNNEVWAMTEGRVPFNISYNATRFFGLKSVRICDGPQKVQ